MGIHVVNGCLRWHDVERCKYPDRVGKIEPHAMCDAHTAAMTNNVEGVEAKMSHQPHLV